MPANTTSVCQPLHQGIIQNFKLHYRNILKEVSSQTESSKSATELAELINVLEHLYFIKNFWKQFKAETIQNCFHKAGFVKTRWLSSDSDDDLPLAQIIRVFFPEMIPPS